MEPNFWPPKVGFSDSLGQAEVGVLDQWVLLPLPDLLSGRVAPVSYCPCKKKWVTYPISRREWKKNNPLPAQKPQAPEPFST